MIRAMTVEGQETALEERRVRDWAQGLEGACMQPGDAGYEEARRVWNGMIDRHPALIVRAADVGDVVRAVDFGRAHHLLTAVRGGGHNVAGHATGDGCLVIDLSSMKEVEVDPQSRTVRVAGGATLGDVDPVTQQHGLAIPFGVVSQTGVAGLTLGGGLGWLRSKYGLTVDQLSAAEVVTADGRVVTASERENPDLLWGLRGGGGNFGIVTTFTYRAHPVGPEVFFTAVFHHGERAVEALQRYRAFNASAPDEVSTLASLGIFPEGAEEFPEEVHGLSFVAFIGLYAGPVDEGARAMAPLREMSEPLVDFSGPTTYVQAQQFFDADYPAGELRYYWKSLNLMALSDASIEGIVAHARKQPSPLSTTDLWPLRGAVQRVPDEETAFYGRQADLLLNVEANWERPAADEANVRWARDAVADMETFSDGSRYLNFPGFQEEGDAMMRAAFGPGYERLVALKQAYDPDNFFRLNQNVKPHEA
jgi:FAD/FMN-containing dehydrogenase